MVFGFTSVKTTRSMINILRRGTDVNARKQEGFVTSNMANRGTCTSFEGSNAQRAFTPAIAAVVSSYKEGCQYFCHGENIDKLERDAEAINNETLSTDAEES